MVTCIDNHIIFYMTKICQRGQGLTGNTNSRKQKIWPYYKTFISHRPKCTQLVHILTRPRRVRLDQVLRHPLSTLSTPLHRMRGVNYAVYVMHTIFYT